MPERGQRGSYGGQAVIEGVMIKGPSKMAVAIRKPEGNIVVHKEDVASTRQKFPFLKWPFLRGCIALWESVSLGINALIFSANETAESEEEELSRGEMGLSVLFAFVIAISLFVVAPTVAINYLRAGFSGGFALNMAEGVLRIGILVGYILMISRMDDIQRVLEYHGAEHKVIHAYENEQEISVNKALTYPRLHARCGTSFLLLVALVSVFLYSFFGWPGLFQRLMVRLALLPVVAGISYELIRLAGSSDFPLLKLVIAPGLWLQKLTTREPDREQIEVALRALQAVADETS